MYNSIIYRIALETDNSTKTTKYLSVTNKTTKINPPDFKTLIYVLCP